MVTQFTKVRQSFEDFCEYIHNNQKVEKINLFENRIQFSYKNNNSGYDRYVEINDSNSSSIHSWGGAELNRSHYISDALKAERLEFLYSNYKDPLEREYNATITDNIDGTVVYNSGKNKNIVKMDDLLVFTDEFKIENITDNGEFVDLQAVDLDDWVRYVLNVANKKDFFEYEGNQLIRLDYVKDSIKNSNKYKKYSKMDFPLYVLGMIGLIASLFAEMIFYLNEYTGWLAFGGFLLSLVVLGLASYLGDQVDLKNFNLFDEQGEYIDVSTNKDVLKRFGIIKNNEIILDQPVAIKQLNLPEKPIALGINSLNLVNDLRVLIGNVNSLIDRINEQKLLDGNDVVNTIYIKEINETLNIYNELNEKYKNILEENIKLLRIKLEHVVNNSNNNYQDSEISISAINQLLKENY